MPIDPNIRFGDLLQIAVIAAGGLMVFATMRADLRTINARLDKADEELKKQTAILAQLSAGEARMDGLDRRLTLLEEARRS
jgi:K+/H+ antiporter YhaU regulatory subunit KhtT